MFPRFDLDTATVVFLRAMKHLLIFVLICDGRADVQDAQFPFDGDLIPMGVSPTLATPEDIIFVGYGATEGAPVMLSGAGDLKQLPIEPEFETKVLIHGWNANGKSDWYTTFMNAYKQRGSYNFIQVDWGKASNLNYFQSSAEIPFIANIIAAALDELSTFRNVSMDQVHILGHSLGAHLAGYTGKELRLRGKMLGRITGLDPAGPLFRLTVPAMKLSRADAHFVDVIHTDAGVFGISENVGHVDFYPNGGSALQPGCIDAMFPFEKSRLIKTTVCSHIRSIYLYEESINSDKLVARKCDTNSQFVLGLCIFNEKVIMGENVNHEVRGSYFLKTNANSPYGQG